MIDQISVFSAGQDLRIALDLLCVTALGRPRQDPAALPALRDALATPEGVAALQRLADIHGVHELTLDVPSLQRAFDDVILSDRARSLHGARDVYAATKLRLWDLLWKPFAPHLVPSRAVVERVRELVALDTSPGGADVARCVELLCDWLSEARFAISILSEPGARPIVVARRPAIGGMRGRIVMYGHYDVDDVRPTEWSTPPLELTEQQGRLYGLGVGDNKAPLALRTLVLRDLDACPEVLWIVQGEEETASPFAHRRLPELLAGEHATLWLEENGYHDLDGTQRILARVVDDPADPATDQPPDAVLGRLVEALGRLDRDYGVGHRVEARSLNKSFFPEGCPWGRNLPRGAHYLAIGLNDPASRIHRPDESVPTWTFPIHARQLRAVAEHVHAVAVGA